MVVAAPFWGRMELFLVGIPLWKRSGKDRWGDSMPALPRLDARPAVTSASRWMKSSLMGAFLPSFSLYSLSVCFLALD